MKLFERKAAGAAVVAVALMPALAVPAAQAQVPTAVVSNGIAWTTNEEAPSFFRWFMRTGDYCTMSVVGTDAAGNKVGISAAHCISHEPDGTVVRHWTPWNGKRQPIGEIAYRNDALDYVVIDLYDDVRLSSVGPGARIDHQGPAGPEGVVCKDGQTSGVTCGAVTRQGDTRIYNLAFVGPGDSGGPLYQDDGWVGINRGLTTDGGGVYVKAAAVIADIESQSNPVGQGLVITDSHYEVDSGATPLRAGRSARR